ncbi:MAG: hypothetical protein CSA32_04025 [Desulfobulbus propionicus]|nr:MAG: hypothetical protein CSA32_04025 [Desulfobulbus propionicus]
MERNFFSKTNSLILIVDDDEVMRLLLRQFLEGEGYLVDDQDNGIQALLLLEQKRYDLVILDINMPGIDGLEVCRRIKTSYANPPPVLMVTVLDDEESIDRSFLAGASDYIRKPIHWSVLRNRIRHILQSRSTLMELEILSHNYEMILNTVANGICGLDEQGKISYVNPAALTLLGYTEEEILGCSYRDIFRLSEPGKGGGDIDCCPFFSDEQAERVICFNGMELSRKDGSVIPVDFSATLIFRNESAHGCVLVFQDITDRLDAEKQIRYLANHDALTQLPNRNYFRRRLPQAVSLARRYERKLFLLFIDLDRFKSVNDTCGHSIGDKVLVRAAKRLRSTLRSSDSICRFGGDEFVILLESTETVEGAGHVAQKAIELLNQAIEVDNHVCYVGASIGISVCPDDCDDADTMLRHADIAMYEAKKRGRNSYFFYDHTLST